MKFLVVGLGNPGTEYQNTRHNVGFEVLDQFVLDNHATWESGKLGQLARLSLKGKKLLLLKPDTYMNLSGKAVRYWMEAEKIPLAQVLVVTDDLALPVGKLRLKLQGSDGGHNGLKSINEILQNTSFPRLRFGIGNNFAKGRQVDYVLGKWDENEREEILKAIKKASDAIGIFVLEGSGNAMTKINAT
jgi:peptidyl-tRNA hydrolase, PTH1 family